MRNHIQIFFNQHHKQPEILMGLLLAVGAAIGFSAKAIFVKLAYHYQVDAITLLMFRMMFALPLFCYFAYNEERKTSNRINNKTFAIIGVLGLLGYYLSSLFDFIGLQFVSAGLERIILFVYPTIVVVLSAFIFGKPIARNSIFALLLSYAGIGLAMVHDVRFSGENILMGAAFVFASTITYASFLIGSGEVIPKVGAKRFTAYAMIVSCFAVFMHFATARGLQDFAQPIEVYAYGLAMAVFSTVIPAFLLAAAIERIGASHTSIVGALGPIATIAMAAVFLNEPISALQMAGAALVISGIMMLGRKKEK